MLLQAQVHHIGFSPSVVTTSSRQNDNGVGNELNERGRWERNDVWTPQFRPRSSLDMMSVHISSGLVHQSKEKCTLECTLSSKEEESSYLWPFSSTSFMLFPYLFSLQVDRRTLEYILIHLFNQKLQLTGICNFWWGERVNINLHVGWWLRNGHTTPEYVSSGVVQTMVLQHYFFRLSRCWRTWSWNANLHSLTGWFNQHQRVSSQCFMYTSLGYMYTSWWWFRLIVTIMGERNVYTKDAQQVHVIGLNHLFRCW